MVRIRFDQTDTSNARTRSADARLELDVQKSLSVRTNTRSLDVLSLPQTDSKKSSSSAL